MVAGGIDDACPTLGDNIVIGVGVTVLGGCHLADSIAIGANAVVNSSFDEADIAIAGIPARKISNNGRTAWKNRTKIEKVCNCNRAK